MRNWRVRWRLTALILVPTVAGVGLAGARVVASVDSVGAYDRSAVATEQAAHIRSLLQALGLERDTTGWYDLLSGKSKAKLKKNVDQSKSAVDVLMKTVKSDMTTMDESYGQRVVDQVKLAASSMPHLADYRGERGNPDKYDPLIESLLRLHEELSLINQDPQILGEMRGLSRLAKAKEEVSKQRVQLLQAAYEDDVNAQQVADFIASRARQQDEQDAFGAEAGGVFAGKLHTTLYVTEYYRAALTKERAVVLAGDKKQGAGLSFRQNLLPDNTQWFNDNSKAVDLMRKVEDEVSAAVLKRTGDLRDAEVRAAIVAGVTILALLLLVLLFTVAVARSMVTPLRRLRTEALDIAGSRLPDVVRKLRVSGDATAPDIQPIAVQGKDEIGEVAQAFDEVHRQAVRLAGEEAELRSNISSMFVNLSRRTQTLVERQISLIDGLEKGEQDGGRLSDLFKLDHLATRMRRNSENLLVLAGHEPTRRRSQPAKLVDVVRAALSEVEEYERVQVKVHRATSVVGSAANDLVHLVAELVENAIQFSPKNSQVTVSSSVIEGGGALLSVSDSGISMTEEELGEANRRLAEPPVVDVSVSRRMGLFVVGRLALRHGIRVQLRRGDGAGLIAMVLLPPALLPDGTQPQPVAQRPAFGGGTAPAFGAPAQNGQFSSFGSFDTYDSAGFGADSGPVRQGLGAFSADTGGGYTSEPVGPTDTGSYPSFPSLDPQARPQQARPQQAGPQQSMPGQDWPSQDRQAQDWPSQERKPLPRRETFAAPTPAPPAAPPYNTGSFDSFGSGQFRRPPITEQPPPSVNVSPMEPEQEEFLPIFASVESAWFRRPQEAKLAAEPPPAATGEEPPKYVMPEAQAVPSGEDIWGTAADAGWRAADAAKDPSLGGITSAGLPKRTPKANLVPGTATQPAQQAATPPPPAPPLSAERVRNRLASYQQGVRRGRAEVREQEDKA
ncbi:nitrate- and nitrite sensing domain-containing protein [Nonomuraea sp. NPDC050556]|uniref:sensor histidine kinase n=1 Tax=Nonomuraea sp. NPDC050556 TaxID=3364369 RepID=UPI00379B7F13